MVDKDIVPFTLWRNRSGTTLWRQRRLPKPNPLYGLDRLASDYQRPVLVVEGEKCADAGQAALPPLLLSPLQVEQKPRTRPIGAHSPGAASSSGRMLMSLA
jgi:hypothetical protein